MTAAYTAHSRQVYAFVRGLGADPHEAEVATQETFLRALKALDSFRGDCAMSTWLCRIARNVYVSHRRSAQRFSGDEVEERGDGPDLVARLADQESAMTVHHALHVLGEPYKEVFSLRVLGELPFARIAELFGKTESWARVTFHRAKAQLREELK